MVAGLEMFDRIERLTLFGDEWLQDLAGPRRPTAVRHVLGPAHRLAGGHCGGCYNQAVFAQGGYRTLKSSAYNQPLWMRSFRDVIQLDEDQVLLQIELSEDSPIAYCTLAETGLGREYGIQVLSLIRSPEGGLLRRGGGGCAAADGSVGGDCTGCTNQFTI